MAFSNTPTYDGAIAALDEGSANLMNSTYLQFGLLAARPAQGNKGVLFYATDTPGFSYDDGSTFQNIVNAVSALNSAVANRLLTVGATTTELDAEANLTFDGSTLALTGAMTISSTLSVSGAVDLNSQSLSNVGAAGNDWTQNQLTLAGGSASQELKVQTTGVADAIVKVALPVSSDNVCGIEFFEGDGAGGGGNHSYALRYAASPNYFELFSRNTDGAGADASIWRVIDAQLSVDANTTWDDNAFDEYDDAMVLYRAFGEEHRSTVFKQGKAVLKGNYQELINMGVLRDYGDGFIGYNDQRMAALLAGGIYQTRSLVDDQQRIIDELRTRLEKLEVRRA